MTVEEKSVQESEDVTGRSRYSEWFKVLDAAIRNAAAKGAS
jgi:hypothetical protein